MMTFLLGQWVPTLRPLSASVCLRLLKVCDQRKLDLSGNRLNTYVLYIYFAGVSTRNNNPLCLPDRGWTGPV